MFIAARPPSGGRQAHSGKLAERHIVVHIIAGTGCGRTTHQLAAPGIALRFALIDGDLRTLLDGGTAEFGKNRTLS